MSELMNRVNAEVEQLWGDEPIPGGFQQRSLGDGTKRYNRNNIETWLIHWHLFSQECDQRLPWAMLRADILKAIEKMPQSYQDFFDYYCVIGCDYEEIAQLMECKISTLHYYWWAIRKTLYRLLNDRHIVNHSVDKDKPCPLPALYACTWEGMFDEPVLSSDKKS